MQFLTPSQYTVAPALVAAVFLVISSFSSDYFRERGLHIAASLLISIVGYTLLITVDLGNIGFTYFAIFMTTVGVSLICQVPPLLN